MRQSKGARRQTLICGANRRSHPKLRDKHQGVGLSDLAAIIYPFTSRLRDPKLFRLSYPLSLFRYYPYRYYFIKKSWRIYALLHYSEETKIRTFVITTCTDLFLRRIFLKNFLIYYRNIFV